MSLPKESAGRKSQVSFFEGDNTVTFRDKRSSDTRNMFKQSEEEEPLVDDANKSFAVNTAITSNKEEDDGQTDKKLINF